MNFIDEASIRVQAGNGGNGCIAFRREKYVPRGGPAGGDGGPGGSVALAGDGRLNTLFHLRFRQLYSAERGRHGEGSKRSGRKGEDLLVPVPLGTTVFDIETQAPLGELLEEGQRLVVAGGGRGGRGNAAFATATRQAPRYAQPGEEGEERYIRCELRLLADVGVVGLPNAGKSTLISVVSAAKPKIADYPFTTLVPQLGVVAGGIDEPFVIADLPGLIEGASAGLGLGHRFLRHVERCRVLAHLVELGEAEQAADEALEIVEQELEIFDRSLLRRPRVVVGTKADIATEERRQQLRAAAADRDCPYVEVCSVTGKGVAQLVYLLAEQLSTR